MKRHLKRFKAFAETIGKTMEQEYEDRYKEPYTIEGFEKNAKNILRGLQPIRSDEILSFTIDFSSGDLFKNLNKCLNLPPPPDVIPIEDIANKNYSRWEKEKDNWKK